jgi:hypothetical protein
MMAEQFRCTARETIDAAQRKAAELVAGARKRYENRAAAGQKL